MEKRNDSYEFGLALDQAYFLMQERGAKPETDSGYPRVSIETMSYNHSGVLLNFQGQVEAAYVRFERLRDREYNENTRVIIRTNSEENERKAVETIEEILGLGYTAVEGGKSLAEELRDYAAARLQGIAS